MASDASIRFFDVQFQRHAREGEPALNRFEEQALPCQCGAVLDGGCSLVYLGVAAARFAGGQILRFEHRDVQSPHGTLKSLDTVIARRPWGGLRTEAAWRAVSPAATGRPRHGTAGSGPQGRASPSG